MQTPASGRYFEEFSVGDAYLHDIERTLSEADNLLFSTLTHNAEPWHLDDLHGQHSMYGSRVVNSIFTLMWACSVGIDRLTHGTMLGNLGFSDVRFTRPVFFGDTLRAESEILDKRTAAPDSEAGIIELESRAYNQRREMVTRFRCVRLVRRVPR